MEALAGYILRVGDLASLARRQRVITVTPWGGGGGVVEKFHADDPKKNKMNEIWSS